MPSSTLTAPNAEEYAALMRLIKIAYRDTGQSGRVASFLLAWWNAAQQGGFDLTDLWSVDQEIQTDMLTVIGYIARCKHYPDTLGLKDEFARIIALWRPTPAEAE
jgi:hypothetical protein